MFAGLQAVAHYQYPVLQYHHSTASEGLGFIKLMILINARIMEIAVDVAEG